METSRIFRPMNAEVCHPRCSWSNAASASGSSKSDCITPGLNELFVIGGGSCQNGKVLTPIITAPHLMHKAAKHCQ